MDDALPGDRSPLIDVHAHYLTEGYVAAAQAAGHSAPDGMPVWPHWSAEEHLALMDRTGIAYTILSLSSPGVHFGDDAAARALAREVNEFASSVAREHPERFGFFAELPLPDLAGSLEELRYGLDVLGAAGVAVKTNSGGRYLGDPEFMPLLEELNRRKVIVSLHPMSPPGFEAVAFGRPRPMLEFLFDTTRTIADLILSGALERFPDLRLITPHGGAALPLLAPRIESFRRRLQEQARPTTEELLGTLFYDMAGQPFPLQVPLLTQVVDSGQVLYGSDYCFTPVAAVEAQVAAVGTAAAPGSTGWREITTANAGRLFGSLS